MCRDSFMETRDRLLVWTVEQSMRTLALLLTFVVVISFSVLLLSPTSYGEVLSAANVRPEWPVGRLPRFLTGADISYYGYITQHGGIYRYDHKKANLAYILRAAGCNTARLRLWHRASRKETMKYGRLGTLNNLAYTLPLAEQVKHQGLYLILNMHFSDTWADPGHQVTPAAWKALPLSKLRVRVFDYARRVIRTLREHDAMPNMVMVGNEINNGMLWPEGKLWKDHHARWGRLASLLRAGIGGVEAGSGPHKPVIMIQVAYFPHRPYSWTFLQHLIRRGVHFDVIGYDYYPYWDGAIAHLRSRLTTLARRIHKPIIVAETAYPWANNHYNNSWKARPGMSWPFSPSGQVAYIKQVISIVKRLPGHRGRGVWWWGAEYNSDYSGFKNNPWSYRSLFNSHGEALPALGALCSVSDPHVN